MSRIDEALKRAAQLEAGGRTVSEPAQAAAGASILERYAAEEPQVASETFQPERLPLNVTPVERDADGPIGNPRLASPSGPEGSDLAVTEQFRRLAAVLHDTQLQTGVRVLMVSSAVPGEGKTFAILHLALAFAESFHRRVLLIDGDLRRPSIHRLVGCSNDVGLADVLRTKSTSLPLVEVNSRLSVLPAGRPHSSPLAQLTSDRLRNIIDEAATHFDWVLIDTPPVALLPDAQLLARMTEGVLFVIAAGSTPYAIVNRSIAEIGPDRIVGTILNRVNRRSLVATEYYGSYS